MAALAGCAHGRKRTEPPPRSFLALDREQQRIVHDYLPASAALTAYELDFRNWRLGRLSQHDLLSRARSYRLVVVAARAHVRADPATSETKRAQQLFVAGLQSRAEALAALPDLGRYTPLWNRSVVNARAGLTVMQDVRDRARLIPLPEDAVS